MDTHKLERLFRAKYENILKDGEFSTSDAIYEKWVGYCDKHKILLLHPEWLVDSLNDNAMKGMVCIHSPECQVMNTASPWLLVPKKFAERALILGGLP
jgi:hypothetical protein